ncbi:MAG: CoA transferase [Microscillaceae bacterium]|nr:CoA transferase [Microscillaceae bacterium]MDW8460505.1 CaiB/BaiF CoA-transferase family protein [Cytophagales bacterium]
METFTYSRKPSSQLLQGIKILDLTRLLPGPLATMFLADMGAEVIKIESPKSYDTVRDFPPMIQGESIAYLGFNRNKKSLCLDYTHPEGKAIFLKLVAQSDMLFEQFRPNFLAKFGLNYEELAKINPKLIYVAITGYGQEGPLSHLAGHDLNYAAQAGILSLTGKPNQIPEMLGFQVADIAGGAYMAMIGALAALHYRYRTGEGQLVDISMTDGTIPLAINPFLMEHVAGIKQQRGEYFLSGGMVNYGIYACADKKYIALGTLEAKFWIKLCQIIQKPEWQNRCLPAPHDTLSVWKQELAEIIAQKTQLEWVQIGKEHDIPISPVLEMPDLEKDEHIQARNMIITQQHPKIGEIKGIGNPIKFSKTPTQINWTAPRLGEDTQAILKELGYTNEQIQIWQKENIIKIA